MPRLCEARAPRSRRTTRSTVLRATLTRATLVLRAMKGTETKEDGKELEKMDAIMQKVPQYKKKVEKMDFQTHKK